MLKCMWKEKCFQKVKFNYKATKYQVLVVQLALALIFFSNVLFLRGHKIYYSVPKIHMKNFSCYDFFVKF